MSVASLTAAIVGAQPSAWQQLSGGCIHSAQRADLPNGDSVVVKSNSADALPWFEEEVVGLRAILDTETLIAPTPLGTAADESHAVIVMSHLPVAAATTDTWGRFAEALAAMHLRDVGERYGFDADNHLGSTPQINTWCDDWIEFNAEHRIGFQCRRARDTGLLNSSDRRCLDRLIDKLDDLIPRRPHPSLLHGDLWSGNAHPTVDEQSEPAVAVLDPACYIGDALADIAMMQLFRGFPHEVYDLHADLVPGSREQREERLAIYQLYHLLNHLNIFGSGYHSQVMSIARRYS